MAWQSTPYTIPLFATAVILASLAALTWNHRSVPGGRSLTFLLLAVTQWTTGYGFQIAATNLAVKTLFAKLQYVGGALLSVAMFAFALEYTGREEWLTSRRLVALLVVPAATIALTWTNASHGLIWSASALAADAGFVYRAVEYGPFFWVFVVYSYLLIAGAVVVLIGTLRDSSAVYRSQLFALLVAFGIPWVVSTVHLAGLTPLGLDPIPFAFAASGVILAVAIFRFRLLEMVPFTRESARDAVIENMDDGVIVVDADGRIVDCNPAAAALMDRRVDDTVGQYVGEAFPELGAVLRPTGTDAPEEGVLELRRRGSLGYYDVGVATLERGRGLVTGRVVTLHEITERRQREQHLDVVNRLLRHNLRNDMTVVKGHAELLDRSGGRSDAVPEPFDPGEHVSAIVATVERIVERVSKLETAIYRLDGESTRPVELVAVVETVVAEFEHEYPDATVETSLPTTAWVTAGPGLRTALVELLTNAIEHNDAPEPWAHVSIRTDSSVRIDVEDDGPSIPEMETATLASGRETALQHASGVGLWIVNWIVDTYGGSLSFANSEAGTVVTMTLQPTSPDEDSGRSGVPRSSTPTRESPRSPGRAEPGS